MLPAKIIRNKKGKSGEIPPWLILVVLAAVFLLPQSPLYLGALWEQETLLVWNGLNWKYSGDSSPSVTETELSYNFNCNSLNQNVCTRRDASGNCQSSENQYVQTCPKSTGLRTDFNTANYDEIRINYAATANAWINAISSSGSAGFGIDFGGGGAGIDAYAEERGGTNIPSQTKTGSGTIIFKKTSVGWDVIQDEIVMKKISSLNPILRITGGVGGNYGGGSISYSIRTNFKSIAAESCKTTGGNYSFTNTSCNCPAPNLGFDKIKGCIADTSCKVGEVKLADGTCRASCKADEVELISGACKALIRTCIDNNLNNICDADDPIVYQDPDSNAPVCSDRDNDRVCDDVASLFCRDSNNNKICDSDEVKWYATYCPDTNGNGVCDGIESGTVLCPTTYAPVCDSTTNITFPNSCFASGFGITVPESGACKVSPTIIRLDCATGTVPIPSGYTCNFETGWLIKTEKIYENVYVDCRSLPLLEGYTCKNIGTQYVYVKTEFVNIDCYSTGCPANSLCQGGICVTSSKRCPEQVDCTTTYGTDTSCDTETGLCVKSQYETLDCGTLGCPLGSECVKVNSTSVCLKTETTTIFDKAPEIFGTGKKTPWGSIIIVVIAVAGIAALAARKK